VRPVEDFDNDFDNKEQLIHSDDEKEVPGKTIIV